MGNITKNGFIGTPYRWVLITSLNALATDCLRLKAGAPNYDKYSPRRTACGFRIGTCPVTRLILNVTNVVRGQVEGRQSSNKTHPTVRCFSSETIERLWSRRAPKRKTKNRYEKRLRRTPKKGKEVVGKRNVLLYIIVLFLFIFYPFQKYYDGNHRFCRYVAWRRGRATNDSRLSFKRATVTTTIWNPLCNSSDFG